MVPHLSRRRFNGAHIAFALVVLLAPRPAAAQSLFIEPQFENAGHFHQGIAPAMKDGLWGFIDVSGAWVVTPRYEGVLSGNNGRFGVMTGGRWGYVDPAGELAIPMRYAKAEPFSSGQAAVSPDGRDWVQIDPDGKLETKGEAIFARITSAENGYAAGLDIAGDWRLMRRGDGWARGISFWSETSAGGVRPDEVWDFSETIAVARFGDAYRHIVNDVYGHRGVTFLGGSPQFGQAASFRRARSFSEGLAAVSPDGRNWGFIDREGRMAISPRFEGAREFSEGVAPVRLGGVWGYADKTGRVVFRPRYDRAYSFREGYASTRHGDLRGFVQLRDDGEIVEAVAPSFEDVFSFHEGLAPVKIDGRWGYVAADGVRPKVVRPITGRAAVVAVKP